MYKDNYIFPAIINKNEDGDYVVKFPDFSHIITYGENMEEAYFMAEDALKLELFDLYSDKETQSSMEVLNKALYDINSDSVSNETNKDILEVASDEEI